MAKKAKKNPEVPTTDPVEPEVPATAPKSGSESEVDAVAEAGTAFPAEHRKHSDTPSVPPEAEVEAEAQAADAFEEGFEERVPSEQRDPVTLDIDPSATNLPHVEVPVDTDADAELAADEEEDPGDEEEGELDSARAPRPPAKLERLQKILSQAGVASRRHAEELITGGRVQVNGKIVTELGSKADAGRDHIRVDGKLLQGAERLRYFVLNKPRGYVTTVSDPEGRPTVMGFFAKMGERLYPVGRLDYLSEGLLLVTNDGDLANKLTKAATGVQKTYLVKVSGQPTEEELERLRGGVSIEKGKPGEGRVRTSPAQVRQVRQGDNPWYEVVLIEGRNRELRKMFEEIGHFVEKIRRVGYGPLVLDQEPGQLRELQPEELALLRQAAEGKRVARSIRKGADLGKLPTVRPAPSRTASPFKKPFKSGPAPDSSAAPFPAKRAPARPREDDAEPYYLPPSTRRDDDDDLPAASENDRAAKSASGKTGPAKFGPAKFSPRPPRPAGAGEGRPAWKKDDRGARPRTGARSESGGDDRRGGYKGAESRPRTGFGARGPAKSGGASWGTASDRPRAPRTGADSAPRGGTGTGRSASGPSGGRPFGAKPAWKKSDSGADRPRFDRPSSEGRTFDRPRTDRPSTERPRPERPSSGSFRPAAPRSGESRPARPSYDRPRTDRPRPSSDRPSTDRSRTAAPRSGTRPFTSSRPPARPFNADREGSRGAQGDFRPRTGGASEPRSGARPAGNTGWKPKPAFGGTGKPASGGASRRPPSGTGRPASSRPSGGSNSRPGFKSGSKPGFKSGSKPGFKSGPKPGFKSGPRSGSRPPGRRPSGGKP